MVKLHLEYLILFVKYHFDEYRYNIISVIYLYKTKKINNTIFPQRPKIVCIFDAIVLLEDPLFVYTFIEFIVIQKHTVVQLYTLVHVHLRLDWCLLRHNQTPKVHKLSNAHNKHKWEKLSKFSFVELIAVFTVSRRRE